MVTVNGWYAGGEGDRGDECSDNGGDGEVFLSKLDPNFFQQW